MLVFLPAIQAEKGACDENVFGRVDRRDHPFASATFRVDQSLGKAGGWLEADEYG